MERQWKDSLIMTAEKLTLAVIVPCYNVEGQVEEVIRSLPAWVSHVIAVNDASTDGTAKTLERLAAEIPRLHVLGHPANRGVGGAMVTGYREALRAGADMIVKVDGDGQMDVAGLPDLLRPLLEGRADYSKGNRFRHVKDLDRMPKMRLLGNIALTFMTKIASGYWHIFDAQNGYLAITREALESIPLEKIDNSYAFENSMLSLLNIENHPVVDVPMPAIYADEVCYSSTCSTTCRRFRSTCFPARCSWLSASSSAASTGGARFKPRWRHRRAQWCWPSLPS